MEHVVSFSHPRNNAYGIQEMTRTCIDEEVTALVLLYRTVVPLSRIPPSGRHVPHAESSFLNSSKLSSVCALDC